MDEALPAYKGNEPYVFVCYAHADQGVVNAEIRWLQDQGINVWYDEGISAGKVWRAEIAEALQGASRFLYYISKASLQSVNCDREIDYALEKELEIVPVYLEKTELTPELALALHRVQALHRSNDARYQQHLLNALGASIPDEQVAVARDAPPLRLHAGLVLMVAALLAGGWWYYSRSETSVESSEPQVEMQAAAVNMRSIAVLPFRNRSAAAEHAYFVDGIHDDVLTQLAKLSSLEKVISRTSMEQYRDTTKPMPQIGQELGVATILEGGVQRAGDQMRINVQLIDAATDESLWAETYDRQLTASNVFAIQSEIASAVADALQATLTTAEQERIDRVPTQSMAALESYFLGRQLFYQRGSGQALDDAIAALRTAVDHDPAFAEAWAFLAAAARVTSGYDTSISDENALALAEEASRRALALNPNMALALAVRTVAIDKRDLNEAYDLLHRAIDGEGVDSTIHLWFGQDTFLFGYLSEALVHLERAYELDPLVGINNGALGMAYLAAGQDALARRRLAKAEELGWDHHAPTYFNHLMHSGAVESAIAYRERFYIDTEDPDMLRGRHLLADALRSGDPASVEPLESHWDSIRDGQLDWGVSLYLAFDLRDRFFESYSRSVKHDRNWLFGMRPLWLPGNRAYIEDPRFLELMREAGTVMLWEQRGYPDGCIRVSDPAGDRLDCVERYR